MKFKIGDKVKYDGGEWLFYGSINAIFDHSISPCYRINVDKIIKKNCKLSITQFEFEIEADDETVQAAPLRATAKESAVETTEIQENAVAAVVPVKKKIGRPRKIQEPNTAKVETTEPKQKTKWGETWYINFENFKNGVNNNVISAWAALNRKEYKSGKLKEKKLDLLIDANFPFEIVSKKKKDSWYLNLEEWINGNTKSITIQQWRQRSVRQYKEGNLSMDKIAALKRVGILEIGGK